MWLKSFNKFCFWVTVQMLPRLNGHFIIDDFINVSHGLHMTKTTVTAVSFGAILSCDILDFGQQLLVCVDGIIQDKATE